LHGTPANGLSRLNASRNSVQLRGNGFYPRRFNPWAFVNGTCSRTASRSRSAAASRYDDADEQAQNGNSESRDGDPAG
jgi:hypothetical protein